MIVCDYNANFGLCRHAELGTDPFELSDILSLLLNILKF